MPLSRRNAPGLSSRTVTGTRIGPGHRSRTVAAGLRQGRSVSLRSAGGDRLLLPSPADAGLDEGVDVTVQDGGGVAGLLLGPQVLDHLVRVQDVGTHLVAPAAAL